MLKIQQDFVSADTDADGLVAGATGAGPWVPSTPQLDGGIAHPVTITNGTETDLSGILFTVVGSDADGNAVSAGVTGPTGATGAMVTSADYFAQVDSVTPGSDIGADSVDIGWVKASRTPRLDVDHRRVPFSVAFALIPAGGSPNFTLQHTYDRDNWFTHGSISGETTAQEGAYTTPVLGMRLTFAEPGTVQFRGVQDGVLDASAAR